jgi:hypothetical protein
MCKSKVGLRRVSIALMEHIISDKVVRKERDGRTVMRMSNRELVKSGFVKETVR